MNALPLVKCVDTKYFPDTWLHKDYTHTLSHTGVFEEAGHVEEVVPYKYLKAEYIQRALWSREEIMWALSRKNASIKKKKPGAYCAS